MIIEQDRCTNLPGTNPLVIGIEALYQLSNTTIGCNCITTTCFNKEILASQLGKTGDKDLEPIFKNIDNGCVLVLQDADKAKVETFNSKTDELDGSVYEPLTTAFDGDSRVKVLGRAEGDSLKEIVVIVADGSDCVMVCFNGDIPKDKIGQLVNNKTINFN